MTDSGSEFFDKLIESTEEGADAGGELGPYVPVPRRRRRRKRRLSLGGRANRWWSRHAFKVKMAGLAVLLLLLLLLLFYPFARLEGVTVLGRWLSYAFIAQLLAVIVVVAMLLLSWNRLRRLVNWDRDLWADHCPVCHSDRLKRIHRHPRDRLIAATGVAVRRYVCQNCRWHGLRVDETQI